MEPRDAFTCPIKERTEHGWVDGRVELHLRGKGGRVGYSEGQSRISASRLVEPGTVIKQVGKQSELCNEVGTFRRADLGARLPELLGSKTKRVGALAGRHDMRLVLLLGSVTNDKRVGWTKRRHGFRATRRLKGAVMSYLVSMPLNDEGDSTVLMDALAEEMPTTTFLGPMGPGEIAAELDSSLVRLLTTFIRSVAAAVHGVEAATEVALECSLRIGGEGSGVIIARGPAEAHFQLTITNRAPQADPERV
jgi:Trypsin-co-occurring domain 1